MSWNAKSGMFVRNPVGVFGAGEIEVSSVTAVHIAAPRSQTLLYQAITCNENEIETTVL